MGLAGSPELSIHQENDGTSDHIMLVQSGVWLFSEESCQCWEPRVDEAFRVS